MGRMTIGLAIVAAMATLAASCGGGGGGGTSSSGALSKQDFISQADAICTKHDEQFASEVQLTFPNGDPTSASMSVDDVKAFQDPLSATKDLRGDQVGELRALTPPGDFQEQWDTTLTDLDSSVEALGEAADAAGTADREGLTAAFKKVQTTTDDANQIAKDYGFQVCFQS